MSDVEEKLENQEDENLELEDQEEQEDLQDDAENQDEDQQDDEQEEADEQDEDDDSDEEEEEAPKPSRREQLRIQQLLAKMKGEDDEEATPPKKSRKTPDENVFDDDNDDDGRYRQDIEDVYRFNKFETRLEVDAPRVEAKYPQLDKTSDDFNPALADAINRMFLSSVGYNEKTRSVRSADIRYTDFVESIMELGDEIAGQKVEKSTTNLKKQVAKTGLRPGGGSAKRLNLNKAPSEMTDEELEAVISQAIPKKR